MTALAILWAVLAPALSLANTGAVHFLEIRGSINPGSAAYFIESLAAAELAEAQALLLRLDTPGGLLSSTRDVIQAISAANIPVIVYVAPGGASATSAGALITISAHVAAMSQGANIGAAHPVGSGGEDVKGVMGEKVTNDTAALARAQAALRGRKVEAAEAVVTKSQSFSAEEAQKNGLIDVLAPDVDALLRALDGRKVKMSEGQLHERVLRTKHLSAASLTQVEMNWKQKFLHLVADPSISAILLTMGGMAIYAEISSGFSLVFPGLVGLFCLLLAFVSMQTLPINVGGSLLFVLGFALLVAEIFVTSYGLLTVAGLAAVFIGGLFLIDPGSSSMRVPLWILFPLVASVASIALGVGYLLLRDRTGGPAPDPYLTAEATVATVEGDGRHGTASVGGEIWRFESAEPLKVGDIVFVKSTRELTLILERRT